MRDIRKEDKAFVAINSGRRPFLFIAASSLNLGTNPTAIGPPVYAVYMISRLKAFNPSLTSITPQLTVRYGLKGSAANHSSVTILQFSLLKDTDEQLKGLKGLEE